VGRRKREAEIDDLDIISMRRLVFRGEGSGYMRGSSHRIVSIATAREVHRVALNLHAKVPESLQKVGGKISVIGPSKSIRVYLRGEEGGRKKFFITT